MLRVSPLELGDCAEAAAPLEVAAAADAVLRLPTWKFGACADAAASLKAATCASAAAVLRLPTWKLWFVHMRLLH